MQVSLITCTNDSEKTIANCCNSIQSQTYMDLEHIVIDNKSNDNTLDILNKLSGFTYDWHVDKCEKDCNKCISYMTKDFPSAKSDKITEMEQKIATMENYYKKKIFSLKI